MSRSIFGWSLPPGCSMQDLENALGPTYYEGDTICKCGHALDTHDSVSENETDYGAHDPCTACKCQNFVEKTE